MSFSIYVSIPVLFFLTYILNINYPDNLNGKGTSDLSIRSNKEDAILGKWITVEKNLEVEVYNQDNRFKAKIIWFKIQDTTRSLIPAWMSEIQTLRYVTENGRAWTYCAK